MGNSLIATEPIVARNFFLDIPGDGTLVLSGVSGLDVELDVVSLSQNGAKGKQEHIKTIGGILKTPDVTLTRMAPADATKDPLWTWFLDIRNNGFKGRKDKRKDVSITLFDVGGTEIARFNIFNTWPSKISTDALSTDSNEAMKETITLVNERIERVK
jgi:phage tail-like protein